MSMPEDGRRCNRSWQGATFWLTVAVRKAMVPFDKGLGPVILWGRLTA